MSVKSSTRQQILGCITERGGTTAVELSRFFQLSPAAIRYHIDVLLRQGDIESFPDRQAFPSRGHPSRRFRISSTHRPEDLTSLAHALFAIARDLNPEVTMQQLAGYIADQLTAASLPIPAAPSRRIAKAIEYLSAHNYMPDWEARSHGPRIRFHNCPFAKLLLEHPELCLVDLAILSTLSGGQASLVKQIDFDHPGSSSCIFDIHAENR